MPALVAGAVMASFAGDATDAATDASGILMVSPAPATLGLDGLVTTYDGAAHAASISTTPADLSGVSITYTQQNLAVAAPTAAGSYTVTATLDNPNYAATDVTATLVINQATPTITWANPADIVYGMPLGPQQLDANVLRRGHLCLHANGRHRPERRGRSNAVGDFHPHRHRQLQLRHDDRDDQRPAGDADDHLDQSRGHRLRHASGPAAARCLGVHPGTFTYTPAAGTILHAGAAQTLSATFTPIDSNDYRSVTTTVTINVLPATPVITWTSPPAIVYGTPLGPEQLDASASTPGTFTYTPAAGTVLSAGAGQTLSVNFMPDDTADYSGDTPPASSSTSCRRP